MNFTEYQDKARDTYRETDYPIIYPALGLGAESGEVLNIVKKIFRGDYGSPKFISEANAEKIGYELGDVLWYVAMLADDLGLSLERIAEANIEKLASRKERGVLKGDGDNR